LKSAGADPSSTTCKKRLFNRKRLKTSPRPRSRSELAEARAKLAEQREQNLRAVADAGQRPASGRQAEASNAQKYAHERFASGCSRFSTASRPRSRARISPASGWCCASLVAALDKANIREITRPPASASTRIAPGHGRVVDSEKEPNTVVSVMQKGYSLADRVLRPALVTVAKAVEKQAGTPYPDTDLDYMRSV
jgi:molecular chaperone GrpE